MNHGICNTVQKLAHSIRTSYYLKDAGISNHQDYHKQIYARNSLWDPPPASLLIEDKITEFNQELQAKHNSLQAQFKNRNLSNLTYLQANALKPLKNDNKFIIKPTDKNLGPAIMDTVSYTKQVLTEHLLTDTYKRLTPIEAKHKMETIKSYLKTLVNNHHNLLSKAEALSSKGA
jgi:hypothetical protein